MSVCTDQFENVTPAEYAEIEAKIGQLIGIVIDSNTGEKIESGWDISWAYSLEDLSLNITVNKAPSPDKWFPGAIKSKISEMVNSVLTSA